MFCDEITTGLDSYNARIVIGALEYLSNMDGASDQTHHVTTAENSSFGIELLPTSEHSKERLPKAIICTIHQPSSEIFQYFSHIILLYHGRCVFHGSAQNAVQHFSKLGFNLPARGFNPADFYLKILSNTSSEGEIEYQTFFQRPIEILRNSNHYEAPGVEAHAHFNAAEYKMWASIICIYFL